MQDAENQIASQSSFVMREREIETRDGLARVQFLVCEALEEAGFMNAFSTRIGGVSPLADKADKALNLGFFNGDDDDNVKENRRRFLNVAGAEDFVLVTARQTHSTDRAAIESEEQARGPQPKCDAMTTRGLTNVLMAIQTADCLPVLIADPKTGAMAAVHAGWRGTGGRITERTIADLMQRHGADPRRCIAALGPNACVDCYEVGEEVISRYKKEFGYWPKLLTRFRDGKARLDVKAANVQQLTFCGFAPDRIHVSPHCSMHQNEMFFSYRKESGSKPARVGRMLAMIGKRD